jgi:hypothetical protein
VDDRHAPQVCARTAVCPVRLSARQRLGVDRLRELCCRGRRGHQRQAAAESATEDRQADRLGQGLHRGDLAALRPDDRIAGHPQDACFAARQGADRGQKGAASRAGTFA